MFKANRNQNIQFQIFTSIKRLLSKEFKAYTAESKKRFQIFSQFKPFLSINKIATKAGYAQMCHIEKFDIKFEFVWVKSFLHFLKKTKS